MNIPQEVQAAVDAIGEEPIVRGSYHEGNGFQIDPAAHAAYRLWAERVQVAADLFGRYGHEITGSRRQQVAKMRELLT